MGCQMNRCCCFNNTQDASFAVGVYTAIMSLIGIISVSVTFASSYQSSYPDKVYITLYALAVVIEVLFFLISIILLYGIKKENRLLMIPWMVWMIINIVGQFIGVIILGIVVVHMVRPFILVFVVILLLMIGLDITCFIVVNTHYQYLTSSSGVKNEVPLSYQKLLISSS
ncbi:uncharacterized protein LOC111639998 [Centruroides sculpturatus]|uniref:uncharacterized protein LOC111639998 n=1 Tax=Centruroides sculpturatus TaxID=218467 RepID=UPI000C6E14AE|nr:uncharacterized protein LOC111639998 [Centruroides sculpturatus]